MIRACGRSRRWQVRRVAPMLLSVLWGPLAGAQGITLPGDAVTLPDFDPDDVAQAAIALVNFSSAPGISGATYDVDTPDEYGIDLVRTSLGFETDITLRDVVFDGFVAGWLGGAEQDATIVALNELGEEVRFEAERRILSARISGGLSFPITQHFRILPYASLIAARFNSEKILTGQVDPGSLPESFDAITNDNDFDAAGVGGTLQAIYDRWFDEQRFELHGTYTAAYSETFNASDDLLEVSGTSHTAALRARYSAPAGWVTANRPWRWNTYATYTHFIDQPKQALGFTYYYTVGAGVSYEWNLKPLNWFGLRFVGLQGGIIFGDDVDGWTLGITFQ